MPFPGKLEGNRQFHRGAIVRLAQYLENCSDLSSAFSHVADAPSVLSVPYERHPHVAEAPKLLRQSRSTRRKQQLNAGAKT